MMPNFPTVYEGVIIVDYRSTYCEGSECHVQIVAKPGKGYFLICYETSGSMFEVEHYDSFSLAMRRFVSEIEDDYSSVYVDSYHWSEYEPVKVGDKDVPFSSFVNNIDDLPF